MAGAEKAYLAIDLGASSGRAILGRFNGGNLELEEVHRFGNGPVEENDGLHWDAEYLFSEVKRGIAKASEVAGDALVSLGVDTWGVDYGLLDSEGNLLEKPFNYRDPRTEGIPEKTFEIVPRDEIFRNTGLQFMRINTLFQLMAEIFAQSGKLDNADTLLMTADLFNYWLTGSKLSEHTLASTSQCFNPSTGGWAVEMLERLGIPTDIFPEIIESGRAIGGLKESIAAETGAENVEVIAVGSHDTASAVVATPARGSNFAYLSSGTWSLLGTELTAPILSEECLASNFTNEGGVLGTIRLLKNATGLWIVQECQRVWKESGEDLGFATLAEMARDAEPFAAVIDPDAPEFQLPGDMPGKLSEFCRRTGQNIPKDKASVVRTVLESLALKSRSILENVEYLADTKMGVLHIVGGGSKNKTLNQFIADAIGRKVVAGPAEATAIGNVIMQMIAKDDLQSVEEGRALVRRSFEMEEYSPRTELDWSQPYELLQELIERETQ